MFCWTIYSVRINEKTNLKISWSESLQKIENTVETLQRYMLLYNVNIYFWFSETSFHNCKCDKQYLQSRRKQFDVLEVESFEISGGGGGVRVVHVKPEWTLGLGSEGSDERQITWITCLDDECVKCDSEGSLFHGDPNLVEHACTLSEKMLREWRGMNPWNLAYMLTIPQRVEWWRSNFENANDLRERNADILKIAEKFDWINVEQTGFEDFWSNHLFL